MPKSNGGLTDRLPIASGIKSLWFTNETTEDERKDRLAQLYNNSHLFDDLRDILQSLYDESKKRARNSADTHNWAMTITSEQRYRDALEDVAKLLPTTPEE